MKKNKINLDSINEKEIRDALTQAKKLGAKVRVRKEATKQSLARLLVEVVGDLSDKKIEMPEALDVLAGKIDGIFKDEPVVVEPKTGDPGLTIPKDPETGKKPAKKVDIKPVNGIKPPKPESLCGKAWAVADMVMKKKKGDAPTLKEVLEMGEKQGLNRGNLGTEFYRWRKFNRIGAAS